MVRNIIRNVLGITFFVFAVALGALAILGFKADREQYGYIPENTYVCVYGEDGQPNEDISESLGGMTLEQAQTTVDDFAKNQIGTLNMTFVYGEDTFVYDLTDKVTYDAKSVAVSAIQPELDSTYIERLPKIIKKKFGTFSSSATYIPIPFSCDTTDLDEYIESLGSEINVEAKARTRSFHDDNTLTWNEQVPGKALDTQSTLQSAEDSLDAFTKGALPTDELVTEIQVVDVEPEDNISENDPAIIVDRGQHKLYLFKGIDVEKTYNIGVGRPGYETPSGMSHITAKRGSPTWINPDPTGWGSNMPKKIGPGPNNPLGLRALNLTFPSIRIHGVSNPGRIGVSRSHGCINMMNSDVVDLYDRVEVGTPVYIH